MKKLKENSEMGLAVQWSDLKIINAVVKGVSDLIGSDSEGKAKSVEHLIVASEKLVSAVKYLDEQYIKAETEEEEQQLWELMEDLFLHVPASQLPNYFAHYSLDFYFVFGF